MKNAEMDTTSKQDMYTVAALHKERWVNISIKYDEFWKFVFQFLMPVVENLKKEEVISSFYYKATYPHKDVLQFTFKVSPFNLERNLKPLLFKSLNHYFDEQYFDLSTLDLSKDVLTDKSSSEVFDIENFKLLSLEEYYIDSMAYTIGRPAAKVLMELSVDSSEIILDILSNAGKDNWIEEDSIENSLSFHCAVLHIFMNDNTEIYHFLAWVTSSMLDNLKKLDDVVDLLDWKFQALQGIDSNFDSCKEPILGYLEYVLETLRAGNEFEERWLNQWISSCYKCNDGLTLLEKEGRLIYDDNAVATDQTIFHDIDNRTYKKWLMVYSIMNTVNGQLGIKLNYLLELGMFYSMKQSFKILSAQGDAT